MLTFTTGAPKPTNTLKGQIVDWGTSRPAGNALVVATLLPDSLPYRGVADSSGRFSLGPLPNGDYLVTGVIDENLTNGKARGRPTPPLASPGASLMSASCGPSFTTPCRPGSRRSRSTTACRPPSPSPRSSTRASGSRPKMCGCACCRIPCRWRCASILPAPVDDSLHGSATLGQTRPRPRTRWLRTRAGAQKTRADTSGSTRGTGMRSGLTARPPLYERLVLRVPRPWRPGSRLVLEIKGVRNITGVSGDAAGCRRREAVRAEGR